MNLLKHIKGLFSADSHGRTDATHATVNNSDNYIENKYDAVNIVCSHLARYAYSTDKRLARLTLLVVTHDDNSHADWADSAFVRELQSRLKQEMINAVQQIEIVTISATEVNDTIARDKRFQPMVNGMLYYKTQPIDDLGSLSATAVKAQLECIGGREFLTNTVITLDPSQATTWHIGRSAKPLPYETNHIAIADDCRDVSRHQATIVIDDGKYYLDGREGGVSARGGRLTRIIRKDGRKDDIVTIAHRSLPPLADGDILQISNSVFLKFTLL